MHVTGRREGMEQLFHQYICIRVNILKMRGILVELIVPLGWKCGQKLETHSSIFLVVALECLFVKHSSC